MIALIGAIGTFHLTQKRIHFLQCQFAMGTHRTVTSHGGKALVSKLFGQSRITEAGKIFQQMRHQICRIKLAARENCRQRPQRQRVFTGRRHFQSQGSKLLLVLLKKRHGFIAYLKDRRHQQLRDVRADRSCFELFVCHAFVRGVHVDDHKPFAVFS